MTTSAGLISWTTEARYLGVYITAGRLFSCNFSSVKCKFYRSANAIFGKLGSLRNPTVAINLISKISLPSLLYGVEALNVKKVHILSLEHSWSRIFMKIFQTFNTSIVKQCQFFTGVLPVKHLINIEGQLFCYLYIILQIVFCHHYIMNTD